MRIGFVALVFGFGLSGCSFGVGAGARARLGDRSQELNAECDNFESCDIAYREALARAERCHQEGEDDCEIEDQDAAASYEALHEQTARELDALRGEAADREAAFSQAEEAAEAAHAEASADCARRGHPVEPPPAPTAQRSGNSWFDSEPPFATH
jgi:hypothetical protein